MTSSPVTEPGLLEEAAAELRKARDDNDAHRALAAEVASYSPDRAATIRAATEERSMEIAAGFARLAAIEAGLPPCCHHARPEQEQQ